ncbi:MAG: hypothetical protein U1D06_16820 [Paracoccaceae bacterium]|nr:hypothetical protein [Paracoccaceae bacterium]
MIIGVVLSGVVTGLVAILMLLAAEMPIFAVILAYPLAGALGAIGFIACTVLCQKRPGKRGNTELAR